MRLLQGAVGPDTSISTSSLADHTMLDNVTWLDANWMFLSLFCGILFFCWLFSSHWPGTLREKLHDPVWCAYLSAAVYSIHQFEEHGYDIFGRRYMFGPIFNAGTGMRLGVMLHHRAITLVNILLIWVVFPFWAKIATKQNGFYTASLPWGLAVVNGAGGHLLPFFFEEGELRYVPGAVQSLFMVPLGLWILLVLFRKDGVMLGTVLPMIIGIQWHVVGIQFPMFFLTSLSDNIRFPLFMALASLPPVLLVTSQRFQNMLGQRNKPRLA